MDTGRRFFFGLIAAAFMFCSIAEAQDSQSLGEVARQQRQQREQSEAAQGKQPAASPVITNEEIPEHSEEEPAAAPGKDKDKGGVSRLPAPKTVKQSAESWRSRIRAAKGQIANLQRKIDEINGSIRFSSVACASCVVRNERQVAKERRVEQMRTELDEQKRHLEQMQEAARRQGYGSSVYDP